MTTPTKEQAQAFALMLQAGMPGEEALAYFFENPDEAVASYELWMRSRTLKDATLALQGKTWQAMTAEERIELAINKHYNELAYFLYSRNYVSLIGSEKAKADTCRGVLEAKLAGTAGKLDPLMQFWADVKAGKVTLAPQKGSVQ